MKIYKLSFARFGVLIALAGTVFPVAAQTSITTCGLVIASPGNYAVNADLNCSADGIHIASSNVSLNLNGHIISESSSIPGFVGILINPDFANGTRLDHVSVTGPGVVQKFGVGIQINFTDYSQVALVTAVNDPAGIYASSANFLTVSSNVISQSTNAGLLLSGCNNSVVAYNEVSATISGIFLQGNSGDTVNNNTSNGNQLFGIRVDGGSNTRVYGNTTDGNGLAGILVYSTGSQVFNNTSRGNGGFDLRDDSSPACSGGYWSDNVFFTRNVTCVR